MRAHERLLDPELSLYDPRRSVRSRAGWLSECGLLDRCPCPLCQAPLIVRHGRNGPYFMCRCPRQAGSKRSPAERTTSSPRRLDTCENSALSAGADALDSPRREEAVLQSASLSRG
jgi:hypothetical protein